MTSSIVSHRALKSVVAAVCVSAMIIWIIGLIFIQSNLIATFDQRSHSGAFPFIDFLRFYAAGKVALSPERVHAYEVPAQVRYINEMISPAHVDYTSESHYLPFVFPFFALLASVPPATAYAALDIISPIIGLSSLALLVVSVRRFNPVKTTVFLLGMMASFPGWRCMFAGNLSWILLTIICLFVWSTMTNRQVLSGIFMACTGFKYNYSPHLLAAFLGLKHKKALIAFVLTGMLLVAVGAVYMGWQKYLEFPQILLTSESRDTFGVVPYYMISITGPLSNFMPFKVSGVIAVVTELIAMVALYRLWSEVKDADPLVQLKRRWLFAITAIVMLTFNIHTHHYEAMFLSIAAAMTLTKLNPLDVLSIKPMSFKLWSALFVAFPMVGWMIMALVPKYPWAFGFVTLYQLILFGLAVHIYSRIRTFEGSLPAEWAELS